MKRVKSALKSERERNGENERAIKGGRKERGTFYRGRENGRVPARTLNLLNALARA